MRLNKYLLGFALILGLIVLINLRILKSVSNDNAGGTNGGHVSFAAHKDQGIQKDKDSPPTMRKWKETDPKEIEKYGMTLSTRVTEPTSPKEWEWYLENNLRKNKVLKSEAGQKALKLMATDEEEYKSKIKEVDKHIAIVKEWQKENPSDENLHQQLQNLYKIRAVGTVLKDQVVTIDAEQIIKVKE